jgi:2,4-dienoyl-CoA reductase (NADPH2)
MLDLVEGGNTYDEEVTMVAKALVEPPASRMLNTGIGWHEARVPTIVTSVPRGAFREVTADAASEAVDPGDGLQPHQHARGGRVHPGRRQGRHDVQMARPFLADPTG